MSEETASSQHIDDPGGEILTALGRIERHLQMIESRQRRIEEEILAAESRHSAHIGSFGGLSERQRAAEAEWVRVEASARQALEYER